MVAVLEKLEGELGYVGAGTMVERIMRVKEHLGV
jgi:hypothetical protein